MSRQKHQHTGTEQGHPGAGPRLRIRARRRAGRGVEPGERLVRQAEGFQGEDTQQEREKRSGKEACLRYMVGRGPPF